LQPRDLSEDEEIKYPVLNAYKNFLTDLGNALRNIADLRYRPFANLFQNPPVNPFQWRPFMQRNESDSDSYSNPSIVSIRDEIVDQEILSKDEINSEMSTTSTQAMGSEILAINELINDHTDIHSQNDHTTEQNYYTTKPTRNYDHTTKHYDQTTINLHNGHTTEQNDQTTKNVKPQPQQFATRKPRPASVHTTQKFKATKPPSTIYTTNHLTSNYPNTRIFSSKRPQRTTTKRKRQTTSRPKLSITLKTVTTVTETTKSPLLSTTRILRRPIKNSAPKMPKIRPSKKTTKAVNKVMRFRPNATTTTPIDSDNSRQKMSI
jgi:hypothetical protein